MRRVQGAAGTAVGMAMATLVWTATAHAANDCRIRRGGQSWTLRGDCATDETIVVGAPRFDGDGFTITAKDPPGGHFRGAILRNGGGVLHVREVRLTTEGLADVCDVGDDRLRGVLLDGASGSVTDSVITNVKQGDSGCQEGHGIDARNLGTFPGQTRVRIEHNTVRGYQKAGILVNGDVDVTVTGNRVDGGEPVAFIARNGVQIGLGADARVAHNLITGHSYTGTSAAAAGVLVVGGPFNGGAFTVGTQIRDNVILGADVGVFLDNSEADGGPALVPTKIDVVGNVIRHDRVTNGIPYHAGVTDIGNRDRLARNHISGAAYDPDTIPGATFEMDLSLAIDPRLR